MSLLRTGACIVYFIFCDVGRSIVICNKISADKKSKVREKIALMADRHIPSDKEIRDGGRLYTG